MRRSDGGKRAGSHPGPLAFTEVAAGSFANSGNLYAIVTKTLDIVAASVVDCGQITETDTRQRSHILESSEGRHDRPPTFSRSQQRPAGPTGRGRLAPSDDSRMWLQGRENKMDSNRRAAVAVLKESLERVNGRWLWPQDVRDGRATDADVQEVLRRGAARPSGRQSGRPDSQGGSRCSQ